MNDADFGNNTFELSQRRYLGSKKKLLGFIDEVLQEEEVKFSSFADIFSGTGVVAEKFAHEDKEVIVNDILESNHLAYEAFFGTKKISNKKLLSLINYYNDLKIKKLKENYFSKNFSNTYFNKKNCLLIGEIREDIEKKYESKYLNRRERAYLITSLIYALDRVANTVGHYDAYRKGFCVEQKRICLKPLRVNNKKVQIHKEDANKLIQKIKPDVLYVDPPYNSRQYSDAYHLLENIAEWKKLPVKGVAKKMDRTHIKSKYSMKSAVVEFSNLIHDADVKYILLSYNNMENSGSPRSQSCISDYDILSILQSKGRVKVYEKEFGQYTTGSSSKSDLKERIFFCEVGRHSKENSHQEIKMSTDRKKKSEVYIKSPLNYTGGKHRLLKNILPHFPGGIKTFYDVFAGGGNVGINVTSKETVFLEKNKYVVALLKKIANSNFEELNRSIMFVIERFGLSQTFVNGYDHYAANSSSGLGAVNKNAFLRLRNFFNSNKDSANFDVPVYLLTLVFYSFNNQIRFNSKGEYNLPVGKRDYNGNSRKNLSNFNKACKQKKVSFLCKDFRKILDYDFDKNDFVYLDPPYLLGLAGYNESGGWTEKDESDLYEVLEILNKKGVKFALSNVIEHKGQENIFLGRFIKKLKLNVYHIEHNYSNSNYQIKAKTAVTREVLVTNYK